MCGRGPWFEVFHHINGPRLWGLVCWAAPLVTRRCPSSWGTWVELVKLTSFFPAERINHITKKKKMWSRFPFYLECDMRTNMMGVILATCPQS